jgi:PAS domain S-box-containing protein
MADDIQLELQRKIDTLERKNKLLEEGLHQAERQREMFDRMAQELKATKLLLIQQDEALKEDIAERKQVEIALRDSHQQMYSLLNSMAEGAYRVDTEGNCKFVNRSFLRILGYENADEIIGKPTHYLIHHSHPDGSPYPAAECRMSAAYLRNEEVHVADEVFWRKDGVAVPVEYWSQPIVINDVITGAIATFVDISERKKAEEAAQLASQYARSLIEASLDPLVTISAEGKITDVNNATELVTGMERDNLIGSDFVNYFTHPEQAREGYEKVFSQGFVTDYPLAIRHASGRIIDVLYNATLYRDTKGKVLGVFAAARDITERKRIEARLANSESRLRTIIENEPECIKIVDVNGRLVQMNPAGLKMLEADSPEQVVGRSVLEVIAPEYRNAFADLHKRVLAGESMQLEYEVIGLKGGRRWLDSHAVPMKEANGNVVHLAVTRDISERKEAQQALIRQLELVRQGEETLRISNEQQRAIFDSATSGIALIKDSVIVRCNRKLEDIFGYVPGELDGVSTRLWYPDETAYQTDGSSVFKNIANGQFHRFERQLTRKDGSVFFARLSGQALDSKEPALGIVAIIDNITFEREASDALLKAKNMAEDAARTKSEFLANMSHEIRTPMNGVLGMLDLLRETDMTATQLDWVETAHSSGETLLGIINDILDFSKLEAGKFQVEQIDFNLVDLVDDSCAALAGQAHAKGLELNCSLPATLSLRWRGDPLRIRQVLTNLIGNSIKFTGQGEVSVSVTQSSIADSLGELRFEVHDTGIGISEEAQLRLFQSFSQADSTTSRSFGGTGLGLSISKKLVELMGGAIGVNSIPGEGACFWFTLPLVPSESVETAAFSYDHYDPSGKRVLIVDDNATNCNILSTYLSRWGLAVSEVDNGSAALMQLQASILQGVAYDLILLDMQMPVMDGLTLAKQLVEIPVLAGLPIILLSSGDQLNPADYQGTGIVQRLMKPVRQMQLFDAMVNALQGSSQATPKPARPELERPSYKGKKVLVVEDNKINQKVIVAKLAKYDIFPDLAENGQLALDQLAHSTYDLIFMDCQMPVLDGYAATHELRLLEASQGLSHQTVIALTANALEGEREKCLVAGMDDYLSKPIISEQLTAILAARLGPQPTAIAPPALVVENSATAAPSAVVWDATAALDNLDGDSALLDEMIALFLIEGPKQLSELSRVQAEGNLPALANAAHAIKGTVAQFYAESAKACALLLEQTARSGQSADYQGMTNALINAVTDLINNLRLAKSPK